MNNLEQINNVHNFANKQGYKGATYIGKWRGYDVYEPYLSKNEVSYTGLPLVILAKEDEIRMSTPEEASEITTELTT